LLERLLDRPGEVVRKETLLREIWQIEEPKQPDHSLLWMAVRRLRKKIPADWIESRTRIGLVWKGPLPQGYGHIASGMRVNEQILSSEKVPDGAITMCRSYRDRNGGGLVVQIVQTKGARASTVTLDATELNDFMDFVEGLK